MNIKEVRGDITDCPAGINVIVHQANINRRMGSGVALALCNKWPSVRKTDLEYKSEKKFNSLGEISICQVEQTPPIFVINLYGQSLYEDSLAGCRTDYNAVISGFKLIKHNLELWRMGLVIDRKLSPIIGIPKFMGCDLAGGNWEIYYKIIEQTFIDTDFEIVIVNFGKTINR